MNLVDNRPVVLILNNMQLLLAKQYVESHMKYWWIIVVGSVYE